MFIKTSIAVVIFQLFFSGYSSAQAEDSWITDANRYRCTCVLDAMIKCKTNSTDVDLCYQCNTTCGKSVKTAYFHYGSECMADRLKTCCPLVTTVLIDDYHLCECYCKVQGNITIHSSDPKHPIDCKCPPTSMGANTVRQNDKNDTIVIYENSTFWPFMIIFCLVGFIVGMFVHAVWGQYARNRKHCGDKFVKTGRENPLLKESF